MHLTVRVAVVMGVRDDERRIARAGARVGGGAFARWRAVALVRVERSIWGGRARWRGAPGGGAFLRRLRLLYAGDDEPLWGEGLGNGRTRKDKEGHGRSWKVMEGHGRGRGPG